MRRERECFLANGEQLLLVVAESAAQSPQGVCCPDDNGIAQFLCGAAGIVDSGDGNAFDGFYVYLIEFLYEKLAVFGVHDGLYGCTEYLHVVLFQCAVLVEAHAAVECRLPAKGEQDAVGAFFLYDPLYEIGRDGQEVYLVGNPFRCLYGGDVGVDEYGVYTLFFEGFEGLRPRIVKLAGFSNF